MNKDNPIIFDGLMRYDKEDLVKLVIDRYSENELISLEIHFHNLNALLESKKKDNSK